MRTHVFAGKSETMAPASEGWDVVVAGGGLTGVVAAGELAMQDRSVLFLEPGHGLGGECTRSKCPSDSLVSVPGRFLDEVRDRAAQISAGTADVSHGFLLEMALEQAFLRVGGKILYGALPLRSTTQAERKTATVHAAVKAETVSCEASLGILRAGSSPSSARTRVQGILLAGAENPIDVAGEFREGGLFCRFRVAAADDRTRTRLWVNWPASSWDLWEAEKALALLTPLLLAHLRNLRPDLARVEVLYLADEPLAFVDGVCRPVWEWLPTRTASRQEVPLPAVPQGDPLVQVDHLAAQLAETGIFLAENLLAGKAMAKA